MKRCLIAGALVLLALPFLLAAASSHAASTAISPCGTVSLPVFSPDGTQIAYYGTRWPLPRTPHRVSNNILQALCVADANGQNAKPLRYTTCNDKCPDPPNQIYWAPQQLLYLAAGAVHSIAPGMAPRTVGQVNDFSFVVDTNADRLAAGTPNCPQCAGPVTVLDIPAGKVVGTLGGKKLGNSDPSLAPDGALVAFVRHYADGSGRSLGIWVADAGGGHLRQLVKSGAAPRWSPSGSKIAFESQPGALRIVSPQGGKPQTLIARGVEKVFGWSPDGKHIAFETGSGTFGKLAVIDIATGKVRHLLQLYYAPSVAWSPDSQQLLADTWPKATGCSVLWRAPANGGKATLLRHC
jgi:WD40 repeat protein